MRTTRADPTVLQDTLHVRWCWLPVSPLKATRWFPYVEETGGKIFRSNGKHPGDVRIAPIADPLDSEVENRNPSQARSLSPIQFAPGRSPIVQTTARILAEILTVSLINKGLAGGVRHDPGEWDVDAAERPDGPR